MDTSSSHGKNKVFVTTSWDDGDILDNKLAALLTRYGVKGTFYITKEYRKARLSEDDIRNIAQQHEIGAHTLTHPDLRTLSAEKKKEEVVGSKQWLEQVLGKEVPMFCYPRGYYDASVAAVAKEAGFKGARSTALGSIAPPSDPFDMQTTLQIYPFPFRKLDSNQYYWSRLFEPYTQGAQALPALGVPTVAMRSWLSAARAALDRALETGGVFHLWGHSWEIEKYGLWNELEIFLKHIGGRSDCIYMTNSEVIELSPKTTA